MSPDTEERAGSRWRRLLRLATLDITPLRRRRDFRLLFLGQLVSFFGSMITNVALPYQVYRLTGSTLAVGLLGLVELVPLLLFAFLGGALADALDRRRLVQLTELACTLMSGLLAANALLAQPRLWLLYMVAAAMAGLNALQQPSLSALLPRLVEREELTAASAVSELGSTAGMIGGPALGGVLIAVIGLGGTYMVDVLSFGASLLALQMMRATPPPPDAERPSIRRVAEGLRYARSRPELLGTYVVDMAAMFFGIPTALFPALAPHYGGPGDWGCSMPRPRSGPWRRHDQRLDRAFPPAWPRGAVRGGSLGSGHCAVRRGPGLPAALFFLALAGGADMVSGLFRMTIWNQTIPDSLRGRLASIELVSYSSGPLLGDVESGGVASLAGVRASVISGGLLCIASVAALALLLPQFRRYDGRSHESRPADS